MDQPFDDFGIGGQLFRSSLFERGITRGGSLQSAMWAPPIELSEKDEKIKVRADLPGINKDDVKVEIHDNVLTIEGERRDERRDEREGWSERSYGHFFRSILLPQGVNPDTCKASFDNGVLEIALKAPRQQKGRQIEIQGAATKR